MITALLIGIFLQTSTQNILRFNNLTTFDCNDPQYKAICDGYDVLISKHDPAIDAVLASWNLTRTNAGAITFPLPPPPPPAFVAKFLGADGMDLVGQLTIGPDGTPDWHISLSGLTSAPTGYTVTNAVTGGTWAWPLNAAGNWIVGPALQVTFAGTADLYITPYAAATTPFHVRVVYADGTSAEVDTQ